ncbi:histidine phosphatase family protein [Streptococcus oricebi]|uniref:Histidine phosphatase family protein n=1 Tax=Streptococcus oricebi TaxID=1547447 RepID=A0ABS5B1I2_9STRE|nr:histidine phosphatase family protein [Streptococcus oricebi]
MKEIYIVRHGETLLNALNRVQGWIDSPLTEKGRQQARELGRYLKERKIYFTAVFSSDRGRALATAQEILETAALPLQQVQPMQEWREFGFGEFEGQSNPEVIEKVLLAHGYQSLEEASLSRKDFRQLITRTIPRLDSSGYAESEESFNQRLLQGLEQILTYLDQHSGNRALLVAHGVVMEQLWMLFAREQELASIKNGQLLILTERQGQFELRLAD